MYKTMLLYEQIKKVTDWSDYKLAQELEVSQTTVIDWKKKRYVMNDRAGQIAAELLGIPEKLVLLSLAAERAMNELSGPYLAEAAESAIKAEEKAKKPAAGRSAKQPAAVAKSDRMPFQVLP
ncbi:hypothetical protein [Microbulbifer taiwanensis]|uniref:Helix-turn-helix transcriptional regulator n=1 Tax=Microbulbifer taiwanensis TaxID=986746 RepID=A0ABW1YSU1_9GAMM|nr:hypothetical protein [Microbulbifer taiwanensis]